LVDYYSNAGDLQENRMPKAIENSTHKHPAFTNMSLFAHSKRDDGQANWYLRVTFSRSEQSVRSLKHPYIPNDEGNRVEADKKAIIVYYELDKRRQQGLTNKRQSLLKLLDRFLREVTDNTEENKPFLEREMTPPNNIPGGKSPLDKDKLAQINHVMTNLVIPFFEQDKYRNIDIGRLGNKDIEDWSKWRRNKNLKWANGTLNKQNRVLRSFFTWALEQGFIFASPDIKDEKTDIREGRRPDMSNSQYKKLLDYLRARIDEKTPRRDARVYQKLFYLYICTIDATGIRPFNSEKNAIKWKDVEIKRNKKSGDVDSILIRRNEKGRIYNAIADRHWASIYEDIKAIHKAWGIESEYLFAHPISKWNCNKNDPIKSFDTQWNKAVKELGWNKKGDRQKHRISKYSIRHRYAARRLRDKDISLEDLAQIMSTSPSMIYKVYWHFEAERNYERLMSKGYPENKNAIKEYDEDGIAIKKGKMA
jgi:hypothetical protein